MRLIIVWITGIFLLSGCATQQPADDVSAKSDSGDVRLSGDLTVSSVNRSGF